MSDLLDRTYLSRYAAELVGFVLYVGGSPTDADGNVVTAQMTAAGSGAIVFSRPATRLDLGRYAVPLTSTDTQTPGSYDLAFSYSVNAQPDVYVSYLEVGPAVPAYDALAPGFRQVVESVWTRFADLYDSPVGGPYLQTLLQAHFGRNRLAQLLRQAVGLLNTTSQPRLSYSLDADFPFEAWGPLLEQALFVETIKHLIRSYVEQPSVLLSSPVSRLDRRDYTQRWQEVLASEQATLREQLDTFRMANLGLGSVRALVSGGAYGRFGPIAAPGGGQAAARGYFPGRYVW